MTCGPCQLDHHWLCNLSSLIACDCDDESHADNRPDPPRSILGERE